MTIALVAPAKVNLWLLVGDLDESGFHHIDTLFCALELADSMAIAARPPGSGIRLRTAFAPPLHSLPRLGPDADNLAVRAAAAFLDRAQLPADLRIDLVKRIPAGGGLGGGSTDAAAVLRALDSLHPGALPRDRIRDLAAELGSDVPFFVAGHQFARGRGRGERLAPVADLPPRPVVLVFPRLHVSTAAAYRWLDEDRDSGRAPPAVDAGVGSHAALDWDRIADRARNDFETPVFRRHPELADYRELLTDRGARPALLAGSGSTVFGVFHNDEAASAAVADLQDRYPGVGTVLTRTRSR